MESSRTAYGDSPLIRLLKFTALMLGLFTLLTTLGNMAARAEKPNQRVAVVAANSPNDEARLLLQIWPDFHRPYPLTRDPLNGTLGWGADPSGKLVYVAVVPDVGGGMDYYRLNSADPPLTLVVENTMDSLIASSPDQQWLLVVLPDQTVGEYWLIHVPTGRRWSVTQWVQPRQIAVRAEHRFSDDSQWLYLTLQATDTTYTIVGLHVADGGMVEIAAGLSESLYVGVQAQIGDWLIVGSGGRYDRVRTDGSDFGPLLEGESVGDALFMAFPADGLVLLHRDNQIVAVEVATAQILWEQTEFVLGFPPAGPPGWINIWQEDINVLLNVSTGETRSLPAELQGPSSTRRGLDSNGQWALYSRAGSGQEWWVYDWATGKSRLLRQDMQYFRYIGTTPDGQWLLAENTTFPYGLYRLHRHDGTLEPVASGRSFTYMGWMPPYQSAWQPLPLLFIGGLLIILPLLTPLLKRLLK